jgi:uncharacterized BrkB/YihY/UPF0761 family membrane protein
MGSEVDPIPSGEPSLAETLRELANTPAGTGRIGRARIRLLAIAEDLSTRGSLGPLAELGWNVSRRLQRVGGGALAALLAYRMFVWLLPFALVVVFVVGLFTDEAIDPGRATEDFGLSGFVAASISAATAETGGPGLLSGAIVGGLVLLYATYALMRAVRAMHSLVWRMRFARMTRPLPTTLVGLGVLTAIVFGRSVVDGLGGAFGGILEVALVLGSFVIIPGLWLAASRWLPNRASDWRDLVPGAVFLTAALMVIHALVALVLFPYLQGKQETYGGLGLAAGILLALYGIGYALVVATAVNAELVDRRAAREARLAERRAAREAARDEMHRLTP